MKTTTCLGLGLMFLASATAGLGSQTPISDERPFRDRDRARAGCERLSALYADFERNHGNWIVTGNGRLHYLRWGKPGAQTLIWLHGSYSNGYEFAPFADSLGGSVQPGSSAMFASSSFEYVIAKHECEGQMRFMLGDR